MRARMLLLSAALFAAAAGQALETVQLLPTGPSRALLEGKKPILAEMHGVVPVNFGEALSVLRHPQFIHHVQQAYNERIDDDGIPEFTIQQASTNTYFYVNRKGERTDITEILRQQAADSEFDMILHSTGRRSFGQYQAVIHIQVTAAGEEESDYTAMVYAYPENAVSRFFARHLGLVERYFRKKTVQLTSMITTITLNLCEKNAAVNESMKAEPESSRS